MVNLASYSFPTTILLVDDNPAFLNNLSLILDQKRVIQLCDKPEEALEILKENFKKNEFSSRLIQSQTSEEDDDTLFKLEISEIYKAIYRYNRFDQISTVVVDYAMPQMNGLDFCRRLQGLPFKKIMLTGVASYGEAVNAFNEGIIDAFIVKDSPEMLENLEKNIQKAQSNYFQEQTRDLMRLISAEFPAVLADPILVKFLEKTLSELKPCEFYLLDSMGSLLLLNEQGESKVLILKTKVELEKYGAIARDQQASKSIIHSLMNAEKLLFLFTEQEYKLPVSAWPEHMYAANLLQGTQQDYYYALIDTPLFLHKEKICSYQNYLRNGRGAK